MTKEQKINMIKYSAFSLISISTIVGIIIFLNGLSCISIPKKIEGLSIKCQYSIDIAVLSIQSKNPVSQINSTDAIRACLSEFRYKDCKEQQDKYIKDHTGETELWLVYERANHVFQMCDSANKPG